MPSISRIGDSTLPHSGWSGGIISMGSPNVLVNSLPASTIGDVGTPHTKPDNAPHAVIVSVGSSSVLVNGKPAAYIGSSTSCGSFVGSGSPDVIIGA